MSRFKIFTRELMHDPNAGQGMFIEPPRISLPSGEYLRMKEQQYETRLAAVVIFPINKEFLISQSFVCILKLITSSRGGSIPLQAHRRHSIHNRHSQFNGPGLISGQLLAQSAMRERDVFMRTERNEYILSIILRNGGTLSMSSSGVKCVLQAATTTLCNRRENCFTRDEAH